MRSSSAAPPSAASPSRRRRRRARPASARRRRGPATASPRARATGSPCAADGLRTRTGGRGGAGSGWPSKTTPYISHASRSCQSAPGYTDTHDSACGSSSSTSILNVMPSSGWCVDSTCANTCKRPAEPATPNVISLGCTGADVSPEPSSAIVGVGIQSMAGDEREVVAAELRPCRTAAARRHASGRTRTTSPPNAPPCSMIASPSSGSQARERPPRTRFARAQVRSGSSAASVVAVVVVASANDDRLPARGRRRPCAM